MARPQNGVNGNISQNYKVIINQQYQRPPNQNMYPYDIQQQVMTNPYPQQHYNTMPQQIIQQNPNQFYYPFNYINTGYYNCPPYMTQNAYFSPEMSQQAAISTANMPTAISQSQMQVAPPNLNQQQSSTMPHQGTILPISNPQVVPQHIQPRNPSTKEKKFSPLTVVDPNSKTDVDLSKYSIQNRSKTNSTSSTAHIVNSSKIETELSNKESNLEPISKSELLIDEKPAPSSHQSKENFDLLVSSTSSQQLVTPSLSTDNIAVESDQNLTASSEDETTQLSISNPTQNLVQPKVQMPDYNLIINKKASDATNLYRKLTYDREYLIKLKHNISATHKPSDMPPSSEFSEEIILNEPNNLSTDRLPVSDNSKFKQPRNSQSSQRQSQNNYHKKNYRNQERRTINLEINETASLTRSKSGFLPPHLRIKEIKTNNPLNELQRSIKGNLNKITPQNFQECFGEIAKLNIKSPEEMSCLINEIFVKAVKEEAYSVTYAQFCNKLAAVFGTQAFKSELLKKCQDMFQTPLLDQLENVRNEWNAKIDSELDAKIKSLYENDLEEQVKKAKDKYFGNIRFIGELFLHQLLAGKVILNCITELLKGSNDPDSMLALCKLLETCGKQIDIRHENLMDNYILEMQHLSDSKALETRIRFKLRDIIDMRKRSWALRHIQQEKKILPKTLEEEKIEAAAEAAQKTSQLQNVMKKSQQQNQQQQQQSNVSAARRCQPRTFQATNLSVTSQMSSDVFGPPRINWSEGSGFKTHKQNDGWSTAKTRAGNLKYSNTVTHSREQSPQLKNKNRFKNLESQADASGTDSRSSTPPTIPNVSSTSVLTSNIPYTSKQQSSNSIPSNINQKSSSNFNSFQHQPPSSFPSQSPSSFVAPVSTSSQGIAPLSTQMTFTTYAAASSTISSSTSSLLAACSKDIDDSNIESDEERAEAIFREFMTKSYFNLESFHQINNIAYVISIWIESMMEGNHTCRSSIGDQIVKLKQNNVCSTEQIINGAQQFLSCIDSLIIDIPKFWEYFAEFLERFIKDKNSNIDFFQDIFQELLPSNDVANCLSMCMHSASSRLGHKIVSNVFHKSKLDWNDIINPDNDFDQFIKDNKLEFTVEEVVVPIAASTSLSLSEIANQLKKILEDNLSNEQIFDYLEKHVDKTTWKSSEYICIITKSILKPMKDMHTNKRREYMKEKKEIIKRLANNKIENELSILCSIKDIAEELQKETLQVIYDVLFTDSIISSKAFKQYLQQTKSQDNDPNVKLTESIISELHVVDNSNRG